ncbi:ABC transporter permease [Phycicoccus flavus]|uniref:ABC transporter permease n=1 Tax=Phycicoccus flavus TaxID=2502783 RepID=UPI000FEB677E|nr:ABC transporter permease [Phycicoccus flavus]NHA69135.1 ABC transporter permease subunit [Phycicoccus flavus]
MIGVELRKLLRRPRTWVSIGLLCLLPVVVAVFLAVTGIAPRPGQGPTLLAAVLGNGALYPAAALGIVLPFFLPIAVAVQAGEAVAGEAAAGTLRYLLVRPVGRTRLLVAKLVSVIAYTLLAVVAVAATGYVTGVTLLGTSGQLATTTLAGTALTPADLAWRTGVMVLYIGWSMVGVASVSLFLSTLTDSPLAAALGGLAVLVSSTVLVALDAAGAVRDYLPTRYWLAWVDLFRDPVAWQDIQAGALVQTGYVVVLLGAAWANFATRDVTN